MANGEGRADYIRQRESLQQILQAKKDIGEANDRELAQLDRLESSLEKLRAKQKQRLDSEKTSVDYAKKVNTEYSSQLGELSSISAVYNGLVASQKKALQVGQQDLTSRIARYKASKEEAEVMRGVVESTSQLQGLQQKLAETGPEELEVQQSIRDSYQAKQQEIIDNIASQRAMGKLTDGQARALLAIIDSESKNLAIAEKYATVSKETKDIIQGQIDVYKGIGKTIRGILGTAKVLSSTVGGVLGAGFIGAGYAAEALGKTVREMGGYMGSTTVSVTALGTIFPSAVESAKGLSREFGGLKDVSMQTQLNTNLMATNMGISGDEAASLTGNFARLNGGSAQLAEDMAESTKQLALQNGLVPSDVMKDVAGSSKAFAEFGKKGGKNIGEAAVAAGKLGVNMNALTNVTDRLLDFESSINDELELGAMLGKNLNLNNARSLAYNGQIGDAVKETLNQLGGIDAFNKMDVFQKRKAAQLLGLSVEEFQKMATNSDKLNSDGTMQLSTFESWSQSLSAFASGPLGSVLKGFGSSLIAVGQMGAGLNTLGINMGGIVKSSAQFLANIVKAGASKVMSMFGKGGPADSVSQFAGGSFSKGKEMLKNKLAGKTPAEAPAPDSAPQVDNANKFGKIKSGDLIKGAAALLILAAALWVSAKAFQEFATVKWEDVGKGLVGLVGLAAIAYILSKVEGDMIQGAIAIAILGAALIPFAFALSLLGNVNMDSVLAAGAGLVIFSAAIFGLGAIMMSGVGALLFGAGIVALIAMGAAMIILGTGLTFAANGFNAISGVLPNIVDQMSQLSQINFSPIIGLAGSLMVLAGALTAIGIGGLLALPVLGALNSMGMIGGGAAGAKDSHMDDLIAEVKGLRDDLNAGKVAVYLDGVKVTAGVSKTVDKQGTNHYAHK